MITANYHTHTARCQHAKGEDRAYVEEAIAGGLKVLGFSDHCPWVFPKEYVSRTRMRPEELDDYFTSLEQLRREYARDITIYIGFEAEYVPDMLEEQCRLLEGYPIDYRILGEHFTENEMHSVYTGFPSNDASALQRYVDLVIEALETGNYLYPAHPDLMHFTGADEIYDEQFRRLCVYCKEKQFPPGNQPAGTGGESALPLPPVLENCRRGGKFRHHRLRCPHAGSALQSKIHPDVRGLGSTVPPAAGADAAELRHKINQCL